MSSFSRAYTACAGREGVKGCRTLFKLSFIVHCDFEKGSQNQHFQHTLSVVREGVAKEYSVYALDNILFTILDDPIDISVYYVLLTTDNLLLACAIKHRLNVQVMIQLTICHSHYQIRTLSQSHSTVGVELISSSDVESLWHLTSKIM